MKISNPITYFFYMQYSNFLIKTELKLKVLNYLSIILLILGRLNDAASTMINTHL